MARQNSRGVTQFRSASPVPWRSQFYRGGDLYDEVRATLLVRRRTASIEPSFAVRVIRCARVGETADELAEQQPELVEGRNVHEQGDVATNFLLADLKPDVQKQNQFGR